VAYQLDLLDSSKIHSVVHVSLLRRFLKPKHQVQHQLPSSDDLFQVPELILQRRLVHKNNSMRVQVLFKWSGRPASDATWKDLETLKQSFPRALAWE
jgi:hypothetical protein